MKVFRLAIIFIIVVLLPVLLIIFKSDFLKVRKIEIELHDITCAAVENIDSDVDLLGKNIFLISDNLTNRKLQTKYPCVKKTQIERKFLNQVKVNITGRMPVAQISFLPDSLIDSLKNLEATPSTQTALLSWSFPDSSSEVFLMDESGYIFATTTALNYPFLYISKQDLKIGSRLDPQFSQKAMIIIDGLQKLSILFSKIKINQDFVQINSKPMLAFSLSDDLLKQLASLQLILQKAKIDGREIETIDLRFDKPVVVYFEK